MGGESSNYINKTSLMYHGPQFVYNVGSKALSPTGQPHTQARTKFDADRRDTSRHNPNRPFIRRVPTEKPSKLTPEQARRAAGQARPPPGAQVFVPSRTPNLLASDRQQRAATGVYSDTWQPKSRASYADIEYYPAAIPRRPWAFRQERRPNADNSDFNYQRVKRDLAIQNTKRGIGYFIPRVIHRD